MIGQQAALVDRDVIDGLVVANHVLAQRGLLDGFGHVSVRQAYGASTFLISRSLAPELVQHGDIQQYDLDGQEIGGDDRRGYLERFLHAAMYRARPDVLAVVHSHASSLVTFSVSKQPLRAVAHTAGFLGLRTPVYDIRDETGTATDLLIRSNELGTSLAERLGRSSVALLRGHGAVVVGASLQQAVYRAVYAESNARTQLEAMQLGPVVGLTPEEADLADRTNDGQIDRVFALWQQQSLSATGATQ